MLNRLWLAMAGIDTIVLVAHPGSCRSTAPIDLDGELVEPVLCFRETEETLLTGHSSLHEMAAQTALEVCGDIDEEENDA